MRALGTLLALGLVVGCSKDPEEGMGFGSAGLGSGGDSTTGGAEGSDSTGAGSSEGGSAEGTGDGSTSGAGDESTGPSGEGSSTGELCEPVMLYVDVDGDGYGDAEQPMQEACIGAEGLATVADDCNDGDPEVNPGMDELCDGKDNDCDLQEDEWSSQNEACNGCQLFMYFGSVYWYCTPAANPDNPVTWFIAEEACQDFGGHLTSIQTLAEHNRIVSEIGASPQRNVWIGLNDQLQEGTFVWSDGSPFDYDAFNVFAGGEPNNDGGTEHCVEFDRNKSMGWNDNDCDLDRPFVCEAPL